MNKSTVNRLGPLTGLAFAALLAAVRVIEGSGLPDASDPTAQVVSYWTQHQNEQIIVAILASFSAVCLVYFAGVLRSELAEAEGGQGTLANISFGGALIAAMGMLAISTLEYVTANSAGDVPAQVTQTLSALQADTFFAVAAGFGLFGIAAGLAILRTGRLSRRLGWLSLVAGVLWLSPGSFVAIFLSVAFIVIVSMKLYRTETRPRPVTSSPVAAH
jgi:hypothetical protein